ncbi:MAG: NuoM [Desulfurococcales archaeon]|nr:NuoM [Desulfurococcales archaeon]
MVEIPFIWYGSLLLPIIVGLLGLGSSRGKLIAALSAITLLIPLGIIMTSWIIYSPEEPVADSIKIDLTGYKIGYFSLVVDGLSLPVLVGISLVTGIVAVYSLKYMTTRIAEMEEQGEKVPGLGAYFFLYNLFAIAMMGMALSTNLIEFYLFLEISLIASFLLIAYYGYGDRRKISLLYFIWTHVAGALFIAGVLYYGIKAGSFDILRIQNGSLIYVPMASAIIGEAAKIAAAAILVGLFIKMAVFGVHMWLPYAHAEAPTPVSALLSPNLIGIAGYALARFGIILFPDILQKIKYDLMILAIVTIVYGGLVALRQNDFKRLLAYSSVSQMGYLLLGISTLTAFGIGGAMLHYLTHAIGKAVLFMVAGVFITELHGLRDIRRMSGLAKYYPFTAAAALLGFMHLVGIPPTMGLWSELLITIGLVKAVPLNSVDHVLLVATSLIVAYGVSAAYAFITMKRIFYGKPMEGANHEIQDGFKQTVVLLAVIGVIFFLTISLLISPLRQSVETLLLAGLG